MSELLQQQVTDNQWAAIDEGDIIDVSMFNFDDFETWLYIPGNPESFTAPPVLDLRTWERSNQEPENETNLLLPNSINKSPEEALVGSNEGTTLTMLKAVPSTASGSFPKEAEATFTYDSTEPCKKPGTTHVAIDIWTTSPPSTFDLSVVSNASVISQSTVCNTENKGEEKRNNSYKPEFSHSLETETVSPNEINRTYLSTEHEKPGKHPSAVFSDINQNICPSSTIDTPLPLKEKLFLDGEISTPFFVVPPWNQSTPKNEAVLHSTFTVTPKSLDQTRVHTPTLGTTFKSSTSLRKELLVEILRNEKLDSTRRNETFDIEKNPVENPQRQDNDQIEEPVKPAGGTQSEIAHRQPPSKGTTGSRPRGGPTSGIPRPLSRIPALKSIRPMTSKTRLHPKRG